MKLAILRKATAAVSIPALALLAACAQDEPAEYPEQQQTQQYPQQQYPQQQYPQGQYPQQPAQPGYGPAPAATAPAPAPSAQPSATGTAATPTVFPGLEKLPDGTCQFTPPWVPADQAQPMPVMCPIGI